MGKSKHEILNPKEIQKFENRVGLSDPGSLK
jgi:hypothetical protein